MLLILTSSGDTTATYLAEKLVASGIPFVRLDTDTCVDRVRVGYTLATGPILEFQGARLSASDVSAIWLRRPREIVISLDVGDAVEHAHVANEWGEAIEGFLAHVPYERWMNHPTCNVRASHKLEQLTRAAACGLRVPQTLVTQARSELNAFWHVYDGRVVAKPLASGYLERPDGSVASIYTNRVLGVHLDAAPLAPCPTLFQEEIVKRLDVRVTLIDDRVTAVAMRRTVGGEQIVDIRRDNMEYVNYEVISIPASVDAALRAIIRSYGLRFAAVDFAITPKDEWVFFEINPNGQWAWMDLAGATTLWKDFAYAFGS
jgi:hypothetical protein